MKKVLLNLSTEFAVPRTLRLWAKIKNILINTLKREISRIIGCTIAAASGAVRILWIFRIYSVTSMQTKTTRTIMIFIIPMNT